MQTEPISFPKKDDTLNCPNCGGIACSFGVTGPVEWTFSHRKSMLPTLRRLHVAWCRSCGGAIVRLDSFVPDHQDRLERQEIIHPRAKTRPASPCEVREADPELATDYDEAVECEPCSAQAAVLLLGRAISHLLITKCSVDLKATLGRQITAAKDSGAIPRDIAEEMDLLLQGRNQSAHPWYAPTGEHLRVDRETLDGCFAIVDLLFEHFYVAPARRAQRVSKAQALREQKPS